MGTWTQAVKHEKCALYQVSYLPVPWTTLTLRKFLVIPSLHLSLLDSIPCSIPSQLQTGHAKSSRPGYSMPGLLCLLSREVFRPSLSWSPLGTGHLLAPYFLSILFHSDRPMHQPVLPLNHTWPTSEKSHNLSEHPSPHVKRVTTASALWKLLTVQWWSI